MTYEEALKLVQECGLNIVAEKHDECMEKIKEAIKKQIPKKPIDIRNDIAIEVTGRCPACNRRQSLGSLWWHKEFNKFCVECGQKLDWSDA